jgi:hypothetical protein
LQGTVADGHTMGSRLTEAVLHGGGDIEAAYVLALAEHHRAAAEHVLLPLYATILAELARLYEPHAARHYRALAGRFDTAAKAFHRAAAVIDPGAPADEVLNAGGKIQQAWRDALTHAKALDKLVEPTVAAAEIWRGPPNHPFPTPPTEQTCANAQVGVVRLDAHDHARQVWADRGGPHLFAHLVRGPKTALPAKIHHSHSHSNTQLCGQVWAKCGHSGSLPTALTQFAGLVTRPLATAP